VPRNLRRNTRQHLSLLAAVLLTLSGCDHSTEDTVQLAAGEVARINGQSIMHAQFLQRAQAQTGNHADALSPDERRELLQHMVEERLMVNYLLDAGIVHANPWLNAALRDALFESLGAAVPESSAAALQAFYEEHGAQFRVPTRLVLQRMVFRGSEAGDRAAKAHARLTSGESFVSVKAQYAAPDLLELPREPLSAADWATHLGSELAAAVETLPSGEFTAPLQTAQGVVILGVERIEPARKPPLAQVQEEVVAAFEAFHQSRALQAFLAEQQRAATIVYNASLLQAPQQAPN
jgi:hypothetical protein